ncbi:MAG: hypothetical protein ACKOC5_15235, partial [Chloroflexota bacterium]
MKTPLLRAVPQWGIRRQALMSALAALAVSGGLLFGWLALTAAAPAQAAPAAYEQAGSLEAPAAQITPTIITEPSGPVPLEPAATPNFDLQVSKSQLPTTFTVGTNNLYFINVSRATGYLTQTIVGAIKIEDPLPEGLTWTPTNIGKWNCLLTSSTTLVSCYYTDANPTNIDQISFQVTIPKDIAVSSVTNVVTLLTEDANPDNNVDDSKGNIDSIDLQLLLTADPTNVSTGFVDYTIVLTNTGPMDAKNVRVVDLKPAAFSYVGIIEGAGLADYNNGTLTLNDPIPPDGLPRKVVLRFEVLPDTPSQSVSVTGNAKFGNYNDFNLANNKSTATVIVGGIKITKTVSPPTARVGEPITFTINIQNTGGIKLTGVSIQDVLHPYLSYRTSNRGYAVGNTYTAYIGDLASGASTTARVIVAGRATISDTVDLTNQASVTWGPTGSKITALSEKVTFTVTPGGSLQVGKVDGVTTVEPGDVVTYTVSITNAGNRTVSTIIVTDTMGANLSPVRIIPGSIGSGSCNSTTRQCVFKLTDSLSPSTKASFKVVGKVSSSAPIGSQIINSLLATGIDESVTVIATGQDINTVTQTPVFDIESTKSVAPAQAKVDETITFKITVINNGTTTIENLRIYDDFPTVLDLTSVSTTRGTGTMNTGARTVDVTVGDLEPDQKVVVTILTKVNSTATEPKRHQNTAKLTWGNNRTDNTNTVTFRVAPKSTLPGTGWAPAGALAAWMAHPAAGPSAGQLAIGLAALGGLGLAAVGLLLLVYGVYARARRPLHAGSFTGGGLALLVLGIFLGLAAAGLMSLAQPAQQQLSVLGGAKPPLATAGAALPEQPGEQPSAAPGEQPGAPAGADATPQPGGVVQVVQTASEA